MASLLKPFKGKWTAKQAAHLARRTGFGVTPAELAVLASKGMGKAVKSRLKYVLEDTALEALIASLPASTDNDGIKNPLTAAQLEGWWLYRMVHATNPLQQQLALFYHDTLCSEYTKLNNAVSSRSEEGNDGSIAGQQCTVPAGGLPPDPDRRRRIVARMLIDQYKLFCTLGLGSYRDMLKAMLRDPAMLIYLDNKDNVKGKAQENFAREVMELFSMGVGNYTEEDVREIARAFTGETLRTKCADNWLFDHVYDALKHDTDPKTVFGTTFNLPGPGEDADFVVDMIMSRVSNSGITPNHATIPCTALYMSWKLVTWFVSESIPFDHPIVPEMATLFAKKGKYNVYLVLSKLFKSRFFYDEAYYYTMYKHPVDYMVTALRGLGIDDSSYTGTAYSRLRSMGLRLFEPPNVAGWNHGRAWINSGNLIIRFNYADRLSSSTHLTDVYVDDLITAGHVTSITDNDGILNYLSARLLHDTLTPEEKAPFITFFDGIDGTAPSQTRYRRKVRGALHLMMTMPRYQLK